MNQMMKRRYVLTSQYGADCTQGPQHAGHSHNKQPGLRSSMSAVAFVGLAFHSLVDGMIIAGAFTASPEVGSRVAIAILLHKFPDGFVMSSIVASQQSKFQVRLFSMVGIYFLSEFPPFHVCCLDCSHDTTRCGDWSHAHGKFHASCCGIHSGYATTSTTHCGHCTKHLFRIWGGHIFVHNSSRNIARTFTV